MTEKPLKFMIGDPNDGFVRRDLRIMQESFAKKDRSFDCQLCNAHFAPRPDQFIFYNLCNECFTRFDEQKMRGRFGELGLTADSPKRFEDVAEWIAHAKSK